MNKGELIRALAAVDDDAEVCVFCTSNDFADGGKYAYDVYIDDITEGTWSDAGATIVAHI